MQDGLAKSGYRINKIDSQYLLYGNDKGNYGIALARVVSTSVEYSGGYTYRVFWQDYAHENREAMEISRVMLASLVRLWNILRRTHGTRRPTTTSVSWPNFENRRMHGGALP